MRILLINKFYYLSGGVERYVFEWEKLLRAHGHEVAVFSMQHPDNRPCPQEKHFVSRVRFETDLPLKEKARAAAHSVWSFEARRKLRALLRETGRPDIAHLHSTIFQLTPSILTPLEEAGVPMVQTSQEYSHICANQHLYNHRTDRICETCLTYGRLSPLVTRCIKGSFLASAAGVAASVAEGLFGRMRSRIERLFVPGECIRGKIIQGGWPAEKVFCVPNFIDPELVRPSHEPGRYMTFFGRLVPQKGVMTFLDAAKRAPEAPCRMVGGGAMEAQVRERIRAEDIRNVEVIGHREGEALWQLVREARAVVVPSEWHEPFGLVLLEGMAAGRAVIATRIGGPAEIVGDGVDGLLVPPWNAEALARAFRDLWEHPDRAVEMGRRGREKIEARYSPETHYRQMMGHFEEVVR